MHVRGDPVLPVLVVPSYEIHHDLSARTPSSPSKPATSALPFWQVDEPPSPLGHLKIDWCPKAVESDTKCGKIRSFDALAPSNVGCLHLVRCRGVEPKHPGLLHIVIAGIGAQAPEAPLYLAASYRCSSGFYKSSGFSPGSLHVSFPLSDTSLMPATVPNLV